MKEIILLSALALVHGGTIEINANGCPKDYAIEKLLPHEDCKQFYQCLNGVLIPRMCPVGLYFDSARAVCDWPQKTNCGDKQDDTNMELEDNEEIDVSDPSQAPKICAAPKSDGVLVAHEICNKFYKCSYGKPVALNCPLNLLYNPSDEQCDWPEQVDCGDRVITESDDSGNDNEDSEGDENEEGDDDSNENIIVNDDPSEAPAICKAEGSESVLVAHENCNEYYKCSRGLPIAFKCPLNLLYNPLMKYCDWPVNVDCGSRLIPETEDTDVEENKLKRHIREIESNINSDPSKAPSICAAKNSDGILVAHENCNQFYKCSHGVPVALNCPVTLLYSPEKEYCDWTSNVDCGNRLIPETNSINDAGSNDNHVNEGEDIEVADTNENADPSEAPAICAAEGSDGVLVAHENCNQFYKCSEGRPVALSCPLNLLYNPSKKYCDWPNEVDCGNRVIPEKDDDNTVGGGNGQGNGDNDEDKVPDQGINDDPSKAPEICAAVGSDGVLVAHENCNQFYKCSEGLPVALSCPLNLLYNPSKQYCDWPNEVDCGNRVIPETDDDNTVGGGNGQGNGDNDEDKVPDQGINDDPSKAPEICAAEGSDGVLVAHENCNQFYKCSEGLPVALSCPLDLLYNPSKQYCDWPNEVECGNRVIPETDDDNTVGGGNGQGNGDNDEDKVPDQEINDDPSKAPEICAAEGSDGVLVAHENCNQFYKCSEGHPVALLCPANLLYNPSQKYCDWPQNVECGDRTLPQEENNIDNNEEKEIDENTVQEVDYGVLAAAVCADVSSNALSAPHNNCDQFYKCAFGLPVVISCPSGLLYNPRLEVCDWPANVECGSRGRRIQTEKRYLEAKKALKFLLRVY